MAKVVDVKMTSHSEEVKAEAKAKITAWLTAIGEDAAQTAAERAPVDTGRLKNSITSAVDPEEQVAYIGTNVEYAPYVELGTSRMAARPYLRPAAENHGDEYRALMEQAMKNA